MIDARRLGTAGQVLTGIGLLLLLSEHFFATEQGFRGIIELTEGQSFDGNPAAYRRIERDAAVSRGAPAVALRVEEVSLTFDEHGELASLLATIDLGALGRHTLTPDEPFTRGGLTIGLDGGDLAPCFLVRDDRSGQRTGACVALMVWGPQGALDQFTFPDPPLAVSVRFYPDFSAEGRSLVTRSHELVDPVVWVRAEPVGSWGTPTEALLRPGDEVSVPPFTLQLGDLRRWGLFAISWKPLIQLVPVGSVVFVAGVLVSLARWLLERRTRSAGERP